MNELQQALSIVDDITADRDGKHLLSLLWVRRLLQTAMDKYFLGESDVAILAPDDPFADEVMELTAQPPQPAA